MMRYPQGYKAESRRRLLKASGPIVKKNGFSASGVDALMRSVGLSGAAFYNHFPSKDRFFSAVLEEELGHTLGLLEGDPSLSTAAWFDTRLDQYLSLGHVEHPELGCALPCLSQEVGRAKKPVKQAFEKAMAKVIDILAARLGGEDRAWAVLAQCVGAVALARAVDSTPLRRKILDANKASLKRSMKV